MNVNPYYSFSSSTAIFKGFLSVLSVSQKKIGAIALIIFGILAAVSYVFKQYFFKVNSTITSSLNNPSSPPPPRDISEIISQNVKSLLFNNDNNYQLFKYLSSNGKKLKELDLLGCFFKAHSRNQFLKDILAYCPNLKKLTIHEDITDADLKGFRVMPSLEYLNLEKKQTNDQFRKDILALCPNLKILKGHFTSAEFKSIGNKKSLENLIIKGDDFTDTDIGLLKGLVNLKSLDLRECQNIDGSGFKNLGLNNLKSLNLKGCKNLSDASLAPISEIGYLEKLDVRSCAITNIGLKNLILRHKPHPRLGPSTRSKKLKLKLGLSLFSSQAITINKIKKLSRFNIKVQLDGMH